MDYFIDLGAGWFLYNDDESRLSVVCDAMAPQPNIHFGPSAWKRSDGPFSGLIILEAQSVAKGEWGQTGPGPDDWKWISEDGQEFEYDDVPGSWPRRIVLKESVKDALLNSLAGRVVSSETELAELLQGITRGQQPCMLPTSSAAGRLAAA
jgi:hypothetical protein